MDKTIKKLLVVAACVAVFSMTASARELGGTVYSEAEQREADSIRNSTSAPYSIIGAIAEEAFTCKGDCATPSGDTQCLSIKHDALREYCMSGHSDCYVFGSLSNKRKHNIPDWVEKFCIQNTGIVNNDLRKYYETGFTASSLFRQSKVFSSAVKHSNNQNDRKKWVLYYVSGYLLD